MDDDEQSGRRTPRSRGPQLRWLARECARYRVCVGDDGAAAALLGEFFGRDHDGTLAAAGVTAAFDECRATRTMAALTAMIDRRPTHCSGSPMPSPQ